MRGRLAIPLLRRCGRGGAPGGPGAAGAGGGTGRPGGPGGREPPGIAHRHVLSHSGARGVIVSSKAIAERVLPAALEAHDLTFVVTLEDLPIAQQIVKKLVNWRDLLAAGEGRSDDLEASIARLKRADTCCFIYTSGTGGTPKAVMLTHGSILS